MANRHLQRHESTVAVAEHNCVIFPGSIPHRLSHSVGNIGETSADQSGLAKARQFRNYQPKRLRQLWNDGVETRAIRQQRMKQKQRRALSGLRGIHRAIGEKLIQAGSSLIEPYEQKRRAGSSATTLEMYLQVGMALSGLGGGDI